MTKRKLGALRELSGLLWAGRAPMDFVDGCLVSWFNHHLINANMGRAAVAGKGAKG